MSVREAAALRRAEEFKRYYPLTDGDGELVYEYFLAHVTHEGLDGAPEIMRRDGAVSDVECERGKKLRREFFARFKTRDLLYFADVDNTVTRRGILSDEKKRFFNGWALSDRVVLSTGKIYKSIEKNRARAGSRQKSLLLSQRRCAVRRQGRAGNRGEAGRKGASRRAHTA